MSLSDLEQHAFAYFVANGAQEFSMVGRFFPYGELVLVVQDKIQIVTRKFGTKAGLASRKAAGAFMDLVIEREGFSTVKNDFGGTMHQFQAKQFLDVVKDLQETNPIVLKAKAVGPGFWEEAFAGLSREAATE